MRVHGGWFRVGWDQALLHVFVPQLLVYGGQRVGSKKLSQIVLEQHSYAAHVA